MRTLLPILSLALATSLVACAAADDPQITADRDAEATATAALTTPMLACNLEYETLSPFQTSPVASFSVPYAQVTSPGVAANDGHYQLFAGVNPTPPSNLVLTVSVTNIQTGKDTLYTVLPAPQAQGQWLFESGARVSSLTKNGVVYDHARVYCRYFLQ